MVFYKVIKSRSYFKRFQVKFRRRREGKTDYYQRKRLVMQYKDRYNVRKYRFVVRFSNKCVQCQIVYSTIAGDVVVTQANSKELKRYGIAFGLTNYAAAYATGLLLARRQLSKLDLANKHKGLLDSKNIGQDFNNLDIVDGNRSFKAILDIGLARSSIGAKVFGAMKGALDGGLNIPHDPKCFVGYNKEARENNPDVLRQHIYGLHVASYMKQLAESDPSAYARQFSEYIRLNINPDDMEKLYKEAHEKIRADSSPAKKKDHSEKKTKGIKKAKDASQLLAERKERVERKKALIMEEIQAMV